MSENKVNWTALMQEWLSDFLASPEGPTTIGALGGFFIRIALKVGKHHPRQIATSFVAAVVFSLFVAPAVAEYFDLGARSLAALSTFFGLTAPDIARGILRASDAFAQTGKMPSLKGDDDDARDI